MKQRISCVGRERKSGERAWPQMDSEHGKWEISPSNERVNWSARAEHRRRLATDGQGGEGGPTDNVSWLEQLQLVPATTGGGVGGQAKGQGVLWWKPLSTSTGDRLGQLGHAATASCRPPLITSCSLPDCWEISLSDR